MFKYITHSANDFKNSIAKQEVDRVVAFGFFFFFWLFILYFLFLFHMEGGDYKAFTLALLAGVALVILCSVPVFLSFVTDKEHGYSI